MRIGSVTEGSGRKAKSFEPRLLQLKKVKFFKTFFFFYLQS